LKDEFAGKRCEKGKYKGIVLGIPGKVGHGGCGSGCGGMTKTRISLAYVSRSSSTSTTMDALKAEIASKRKILQDEPLAERPTKYMRRGDIERLRQEQEQNAQEKRKREEAERRQAADTSDKPKGSRVSSFYLGPSVF